MTEFGFIGCGNMGGTLCVAASKTCLDIIVYDKDTDKSLNLANSLNIKSGNSSVELALNSRFIVLGVKPQVLPFVLEEISPYVNTRKDRCVFISMAAGVTTDSICEMIGKRVPVIRIMPNTPAEVGKGMILYTHNELVTAQDTDIFIKAFAKAGEFDEISENLIDVASAVSGCGPAFAYMFIDALTKGGVKNGLSLDKALKYAATTVIGASEMVLQTGRQPDELKNAVCSPAGSTIEGVKVLQQEKLQETVINAVTASFNRTKELGKN